MIQDDLATSQIHSLANALKQQKNPNAIIFSQIIDNLKAAQLGQTYPGFKLTTYLIENQNPSFLKILWKAIVPYNSVHNVYEFTTKYPRFNNIMNDPFTKGLRSVFWWGAFPNKELLYTLIASNKLGLQQKRKLTLFKLYLQYSFLGAIRSSIQTSLLPITFGLFAMVNIGVKGFLEAGNINIQGISKLTDEEKNLLKSENFIIDLFSIIFYKYIQHLYKTWTTIVDVGSGGLDSKIYKAAAGLGIPNEVKSFDDSVIANIITFVGSMDFGNMKNKSYNSFYAMIVSALDELFFGPAKKDIENEAKTEGERIQAGDTGIDINNPTWKVVPSPRTNISLIDINFPYKKTKYIKINNQYNLTNTDFKNVNNIVRISTPKNFEINAIQITDINNKTHNIKPQ